MRASGLPSPSARDWSLQSSKPKCFKDEEDERQFIAFTLAHAYFGHYWSLKRTYKVWNASLEWSTAGIRKTYIKGDAKLQRKCRELTQTTPDQSVDDEAVYIKVAGECPKGHVYNLRSLGRKKRRYVDPDASTSQVLAQRGMGNFMILRSGRRVRNGEGSEVRGRGAVKSTERWRATEGLDGGLDRRRDGGQGLGIRNEGRGGAAKENERDGEEKGKGRV
ncbi:hypothetical protein Syun_029920 [Stephania yunnanensis]|uniref:Uncharacterized protein n=1 Tax=Stephania yunnanensis TaxID=152371 RepID=A0AAP0HKA8_9MAGN